MNMKLLDPGVLSVIILLLISQNILAGIVILSPKKGDVLIEGQTYTVKWKTSEHGFMCVEGAVGGKDKGILNNCGTPAQKGR